ncbi:unnamed protein product [Periconia digitata]|uniref:Uncharacterized protein n=1 Tax=Periconia digitata TaxID=1303443 RepID=A0A9W4UAJ4_9PLEO|nr:unnamed protein product [Periconia digitata]
MPHNSTCIALCLGIALPSICHVLLLHSLIHFVYIPLIPLSPYSSLQIPTSYNIQRRRDHRCCCYSPNLIPHLVAPPLQLSHVDWVPTTSFIASSSLSPTPVELIPPIPSGPFSW